MTEFIEVDNVTLQYGRTTALKNVSFSLRANKIYGLLGRNGAGKTSLLTLFAAFQRPTSGTIRIAGEDPFENAKIMQNIAFIYKQDHSVDTETVKETIDFLKHFRPNFNEEYAYHLIEKFALPLTTAVNKLSTGKQSAFNIVIGLASRAPVTIFDEAYLGMDAPSREIFYQEILNEQERFPRTFILSTHLVSEMDYLFDEVLMIHRGKLLLHEDYETIISRGASITGPADQVDEFVRGRRILNKKRLGPTKSVMIYGKLSDDEIIEAQELGLEIGPVALQDLFIHLTGGKNSDEKYTG